MSRKRVIVPDELEEIGGKYIRNVANFYDEQTKIASWVGRSKESSFPMNSQVKETWNECFNLYYKIMFESSAHIRAAGSFLVRISEEARVEESDLQSIFDGYADDVLAGESTDQGPKWPNPTPEELQDRIDNPNDVPPDLRP